VRNLTTGTNKGDMGPMKATGKAVTTHGADLLHVVGGKIVEGFGYGDEAEMMQQMGMMPAPPTAPPTAK
jgi:predicted ester cyclase